MLTVDLSKFATLLLILYPSKVCEYFLLFLTHCQCILFELKMFENFEEHSETERGEVNWSYWGREDLPGVSKMPPWALKSSISPNWSSD